MSMSTCTRRPGAPPSRWLAVSIVVAGACGSGCSAGLPVATSAACVESGQIDVWKPVAAALTTADRGRVLACEHVRTVSATQLAESDNYKGRGWTADNGYEEFVIQHASEGPAGQAHRGSALLYLPAGGKPPYPLVAVNHGTNGIGPKCGPTHERVTVDYMALPLVGHGYAVVAADYPGMGVDEGIYAYGVGDAEGRGILDAVRAARQFKDARFDGATDLTDELFLYGHSQGGHATLFAQQLHDGPSSVGGFRLLGAVSVAPGLADLRGLEQIIGQPARALDAASLFMLMTLYSHATYRGAPAASEWLTPSAALTLPGYFKDQCWSSLSVTVPGTFFRNDGLYLPAFLTGASGCPFNGSACPNFSPWAGYFQATVPGDFKSDVPVLLLQGESDDVVPATTTACLSNRLAARGTPLHTCGYAGIDHYKIVGASMDATLAWMSARRAGRDENPCPAPLAAKCP